MKLAQCFDDEVSVMYRATHSFQFSSYKISDPYVSFIHVRWVPLSPIHGASLSCRWRDGLQQWRASVNILNKQPQTNDKGWYFRLDVGHRANPLTVKSKLVMKNHKEPRTWMDSLDKKLKRRNMGVRFGTWIIRSLYKAGSLMTVSKELFRYTLDLVGLQEVR
jgi:hypothetical protein